MASVKTVKATTPKATTAKTSAMAQTLASISAAVVTATTTAQVKKAAVAYTDGVNPLAPANATPVLFGGMAYNGALPATNPANRGTTGTSGATASGKVYGLGNGKGPRAGHNLLMWQAVTAALPASGADLANAAGSGGAAFVQYAIKNGWLAVA